MRTRPGLCSVTLRELEVPQVVELARRAQLEGIEWGADVHVPPNDGGAIAMARRATEAAGLEIPSYGSYLTPASNDDEIAAVISTASALGAPNVRIWAGGKEPELTDNGWTHPEWDAAVTGLRRIADAAANTNLTVSLEFHGWTLTHKGAAAAQLVSQVDAGNLYTYFQPNYWDEPLVQDTAAQVTELAHVLPHLSHLHVYWWPVLGARAPLAEGEPVWSALLNSLHTNPEPGRWDAVASHDRWAFLEFVHNDSPEQLGLDASTLLDWLS